MKAVSRWAPCLLATLALAAPARAQQPAPSPAAGAPEEPVAESPYLNPPPDTRPVLNLTLDDAVKRALENNVDIAVSKYTPEDSELNIQQLQGAFYEPLAFTNVLQNSRAQPATSAFSGASKVDTDTTTWELGGQKNLKTGGNLKVDWQNNRQSTNSVFNTFNPSFGSTFNATLTQPLLRNLSIDSARQQIRVAKKNREISDVQFRQTVVNTLANVKSLYYDYLYAIENLEAQRRSLSLANRLLGENRIRVRVGTMAPLDVVSAESEQASREEGVIVAQQAVADAEDQLKRALFPNSDAATWDVRLVPTDRPVAEPVTVDVEAAIHKALAARTDITAAHRSIDIADIGVQFAHNQKMPQLDLVAGYGVSGIGGTQLERSATGGPIISTLPGGYNDALSNIFSNDYPSWQIGVNVSYAFLNRQAGASEARAQLSRNQAQATLRQTELQVTTEVRSAARAVSSGWQRVQSTRAARVLAERRLDAEEKKFAAGMSTNFLVTQTQRDLTVAEVSELQATADYSKSIVTFERVQEAGGAQVGSTFRAVVNNSRAGSTAASSAASSAAATP